MNAPLFKRHSKNIKKQLKEIRSKGRQEDV
jgi:hypothetical protein